MKTQTFLTGVIRARYWAQYYLHVYAYFSQLVSYFEVSRNNFCMYLTSPRVLHALLLILLTIMT